MSKSSIVGDPINFRGFVYGPANEMGVVALFVKVSEDIGYIIEEIRAAFPDCIARKKVDRGWERVAIEFEYKSSNFEKHGHDPAACDLIVCWEHDWDICPVSVLALKEYLRELESPTAAKSAAGSIIAPKDLRTVTITEGAIRNGYVNIKPIDGFWPADCMGTPSGSAEKHMIVEFEGVGRTTTDITYRHKTFRKTSTRVKEFFKKHCVKPGDKVEILRLANYEYRIRPCQKKRQ